MRKPFPRSITANAARNLIAQLNINAPEEIDIELIAAHFDVFIKFRKLHHQEGHLLRLGQHGLIVIDEDARESKKWRFVAAHELGHFLRHPNLDQFKLCTDADLHNWYLSSGHETEANDFAAELLMPEPFFKKRCDRNKPSLRDIQELAGLFNTTLTATSLRFIAFSDEPCAVVYSTKGRVDWFACTANFRYPPERGMRLSNGTYAFNFFAGREIPNGPETVNAKDWCGLPQARGCDMQEHSLQLGRYGAVLTLLWHPEE